MLNKRIEWIDTVRGISIFLVVLGHTILPYPWLIYVFSFHMPIFFFLSGYVYNPQKYTNLWSIVKRKANTLLWPYLFFFLINFIYWILFFGSKQYFEPIWKMLYSSNTLSAPFIPLWFLTCLFVLEILFFILQKKFKSFGLLIMVLFSTILGFWLAYKKYYLPWGIDIAMVAILFYYLGFILKNKMDQIDKIKNIWIYLFGFVMLIANYLLAQYQNIQTSIFYRFYDKPWLFLLVAICGILGYMILAKFLKKTLLKNITIIDWLGRNSLIILGLHTIFYYYVSDFFRIYLHIYPKTSVLYSFIYTIITLVMITPFIYLINKTPILTLKTKLRSR